MLWEAVELLDMVKKESGRSFCYDHCMCWNKVYSLGDRIYNSYNSIMSGGLQEFDHKIDTECVLPCVQNGEQLKFANWRVLPGFRLKGRDHRCLHTGQYT